MSSSLSSKASYNGLHHMSSQTLRLRSFSGWLASYGAPAETLVITSSFINKYNMRTSCNSDLRLQIFPSTAAASGTATTSNEQRSLSKSGTATTNGENGRLLDTNKHPDTILKRQIRSKIVGISEEHVRTADSRFRSHNDRNTTNTSNCIVGALASAAPQHQNQSLPSIEPLRSFAPCNSAAAALKLHTSDAGATVMGTTSNRIDASAAASNAGSDSTVLPGPAAAAAVPASESGISHATPVRRHLPFQGTFMWRARRPARSTQPLNGVGSGSGSVGGKRTALTAAAARDGGHVPPVSRTYKPIRSSPGQTASSRTRDMSTRNINSSTRCRSVSRSSAPARSINTSHSRMPLEDSNRSSSSSSSSSIKNRESCNGGNVPQVPKAQVQEELPNDATIRTRQVTKAATAAAAASTSSSDSSSSAVATELQGNGRRRAFHRTPGAVAAAAVATATSTGGAATTAKRTSDDVMRITNGGNQMPRISVTASSSRTATEISPGSGRSRAFTATAGDGAASSSSIDCSSSSAPGSKGPYPRTSRGHLHPQNRFSRGASRSAQQQRDNPWSIRCTPIDMEATYPSLVSFAAAVRSQAASSWHPLVISAALNHATKMMETLDRRKMAPELQEGIGSDDRRNFDTEDEKTANPGSRDTFSPPSPQHAPVPAFGSNSREGSYPDEKIIREILDILYDAYLPYVRTTINSRYVINALWVCAKTGYWGAPGHRLVPALFARLRHDNYTLLCRSDGQAHGILWWALSQCDAQQQQQQKNGAVAVAAVRGEGRGRTGLSKGQAVANGRSTSNETRPPTAAAAAATRVAAAAGPTAEGGGGAGGGGGSPLVSGCMDLLRLSASIIKKRVQQHHYRCGPIAVHG
ncbi:hypothetical protein Vafri_9685 [Volvox africanus]|uniref:Uncharacterized protein n=1 Tax=Volvox africanus TaxID=51714 RepID=A0A8J4B5F3_9CHLO|nr:hypothetical protein Vafri_9685 [Volvox africanus]